MCIRPYIVAADGGALSKSHTRGSMPSPGQIIDWVSLSLRLCLKAYSKDGPSAAPWPLSARRSDIWDVISLLLDFIQPDKQNRSWGEQTSGCQPPISLWTGLGPLPGNPNCFIPPSKLQMRNRLRMMLVIIHLKSLHRLCEDFSRSSLASVHFSVWNQQLWLCRLPQRGTRSSPIPSSKTLHLRRSPRT